MKRIVDMMIEKDYQNDLLELYEKETGKDPVPEEGGHTPEFEVWFVKKCEEAEKAGCKDAESALDYIWPPPEKMSKEPQIYYILMEEWLYPTESGRDFVEDYDTYKGALAKARECCDSELYNFASATGCDPSRPEAFINKDGTKQGVCITCKDGLEEWWYAVKIIPVEHGL